MEVRCPSSTNPSAEAQERLTEFLNAELNLARTFMQSVALAQSEGKTELYQQAKTRAASAVESVQRFVTQVVDGGSKAEIRQRLVESLNG